MSGGILYVRKRALDANAANLHRTPGTTERLLAIPEGRNALEAALLLLDHRLASLKTGPHPGAFFSGSHLGSGSDNPCPTL